MATKTTIRRRITGNGHAGNGHPTIEFLDPRIASRLDEETSRSRLAILIAAVAVIAAGITIFVALVTRGSGSTVTSAPAAAGPAAPVAADDPAAQGIDFEKYATPDPTLPAVPAGDVKKFTVDVYEHVTRVSDAYAPTRVWGFGVNGTFYRGTGVSPPIVVNQGDRVEITLRNGSSKAMDVTMPHSIDFHSAEVAPNVNYTDIGPGETKTISFVAKHPGVFMYHCATQPVLMHTGAGMVGMMVVKPNGLPPADKELWMTQEEYYLGDPGEDPSLEKMEAKTPDVIAFNGYANQYKDMAPIDVKKGETVRMFVLNAGPSLWSAFHVIGTVFDTAHTDNGVARDVQTINLAPSQGGWVDFTLDEEGSYPFVTHSFADAAKGAVGVLQTQNADTSTTMEH